jgi:Tol biopolymer transport system component
MSRRNGVVCLIAVVGVILCLGTAIAQTGHKILFAKRLGIGKEIYIMDMNGDNQRPLIRAFSEDLNPDWSPDGTNFIFASTMSGSFQIMRMDGKTGQVDQLTYHQHGSCRWPIYSPNGERIVFYSDLKENNDIFLMDSAGSIEENLTEDHVNVYDDITNDTNPSWIDDTNIIYRRDGILTRMNVDDGTISPITDMQGIAEPHVSPDESQIVFVSGGEIYVMDVDGSNLEQLTFSSESGWHHAYSPRWGVDETQIVFEWARGDGSLQVCIMDTDGTTRDEVNLSNDSAYNADPEVSLVPIKNNFFTTVYEDPGPSVGGQDFMPTQLTLSAPSEILYDFDGSNLEIPVTVTGTPAGLVFSVFTKDKGDDIGRVENGYLGWHVVNTIDTCVYFSQTYNFNTGPNTVTWNGQTHVTYMQQVDDDDLMPADNYTYYMWAFDNDNYRQLATVPFGQMGRGGCSIHDEDSLGNPLAQPFIAGSMANIDHSGDGIGDFPYKTLFKWTLGGDPINTDLLETTYTYNSGAGANPVNGYGGADRENWPGGQFCFDPNDPGFFYIARDAQLTDKKSVYRYQWISNGAGVRDTSWGTALTWTPDGGVNKPCGVKTDGTYLFTFTNDQGNWEDPSTYAYIIDMATGAKLHDFIHQDWTDEDTYAGGAGAIYLNGGGPTTLQYRNGRIHAGSFVCLKQAMDPAKYMETEEYEDFIVWTNKNGDWVSDFHWWEGAAFSWSCFGESPPKNRSHAADALDWVVNRIGSYGATSFDLFAPDGTGIGYFAINGEFGTNNGYCAPCDTGGGPWDGLYIDAFGTSSNTGGLYFIAQDTITGTITNIPTPQEPEELLASLLDDTESLVSDGILTENEAQPLIAKLEAALAKLGGMAGKAVVKEKSNNGNNIQPQTAVNILNAFINQVQAWSGKKLTEQQADDLISFAEHIIAVIEETDGTAKIAVAEQNPIPYQLSQNAPNPFNPVTTIEFQIPAASSDRVTVKVYDMRGAVVNTLVDRVERPGVHSVVWDGTDDSGNRVSSGVYIYQLKAGNFVQSNKMTLMR